VACRSRARRREGAPESEGPEHHISSTNEPTNEELVPAHSAPRRRDTGGAQLNMRGAVGGATEERFEHSVDTGASAPVHSKAPAAAKAASQPVSSKPAVNAGTLVANKQGNGKGGGGDKRTGTAVGGKQQQRRKDSLYREWSCDEVRGTPRFCATFPPNPIRYCTCAFAHKLTHTQSHTQSHTVARTHASTHAHIHPCTMTHGL